MIVASLLKDQNNIRHGFFTRQGGVSSGIYNSLNCGYGSDDANENVDENRRRVAAKLGTEHGNIVTVRQVHSSKAVIADAGWLSSGAMPEADAVVTAEHGLAIGVLSADCTPILFCDADASIIGAAHAGWRGAKAGIIEATLDLMEQLGASRTNICAAIGPTISQQNYEVGDEFRDGFVADHADNANFFISAGKTGKPHFDLPGYCKLRLIRSNIGAVEATGECTYENDSLFYSYRRSVHRREPDYGRQISAMVIL